MRALLFITATLTCQAADADVYALAGRWSGSCSYQAASAMEFRQVNRILRPIDVNAFDVLESLEGGNSSHHPKVDIVLDVDRYIVTRESGSVFVNREKQKKFIFAEERGAWVLKLTGEEEGAACFFKSLISTMEKDPAFGAIRPSFDCKRATQPREKAICASGELSLLDQQLGLAYRAAQWRVASTLDDPKKRAAGQSLTRSQSTWWSTKLAACQAGDCVASLYQERIQHLDALK